MIDVAFTPDAVRRADVAVVIDVLRASSTICQALAGGYERVLCCRSIEDARALRAPGRIIAGERECVAPPGFDLGNSPADFASPRGEEVVLTTTNGAPALLAAAECAGEILVGCLVNLAALLEAIDARDDVVLVCAGTDGRTTIEDVYCAGRIAGALEGPRTDAAQVAEAVTLAHPDPRSALAASAGARGLESAGLQADVDWCSRESVLAVVPRLAGLAHGIATVDAGAQAARATSAETPSGPTWVTGSP